MPSQTSLLGAAGEYYVMSELLRRGYIAALAPQGLPTTDIVVTDIDGERHCSVQVKSRRDKGTDGGWLMGVKHEGIRAERLFYCLVNFGSIPDDRPKVYVLPSKIVADAVRDSHSEWLGKLGNKAERVNDNETAGLII